MYWVIYWLGVAAWAVGITISQADVKCDHVIDGQYYNESKGIAGTGCAESGGGSW